ncbi:MAG: glycerol-3-phosphate acyltransferase, partial [Chloroflexi bacterium]
LGSLPMGYFIVKLLKKGDITQVGSGRTGGTNAMRAGGVWAGLLTGVLDFGKGFAAVWLARTLMRDQLLVQAFAGAAAVLGHNWSLVLFLLTKRFSAGAGTGPNIGAATAFWPLAGVIAVPVILLFVFIVGYASLASIAAALLVLISFTLLSVYASWPWQYVVFGFVTTSLVIVALLPNIDRLIKGTERRVGLFAKKRGSSQNA